MEPLNEDWMELFDKNVDAHEKNVRDQERAEELQPLMRDALALRLLDTFDPKQWTTDSEAVRKTWPAEARYE